VSRISFFHGIAIYLYFGDHNPPHIHVLTGEHRARVEIATGTLLSGSLPPRAHRLVRRWLELRRSEVAQCWTRATAGRPPGMVEGLR